MEKQGVFIEEKYPAESGKVWEALTNRDEMEQWYFKLEDFKPEVGFEFQFMGGPTEDRQYLHLCKVTEVIPGRKLSHSWRYDGHKGNTLVTFMLIPDGAQTALRFSHEGLETFPADNPDLAAENFRIGWNSILRTSLKEYLQEKPEE